MHLVPSEYMEGERKVPTDCQKIAEQALQQFITANRWLGWQPAELAMALADAADDYILRIARARASRH